MASSNIGALKRPVLFAFALFVFSIILCVPAGHGQILDDWGEVDAVPQLWFNRVDGLHAGAELWIPLIGANEITVDGAYKTALRDGGYGVRWENKYFNTLVGGSYRRDTDLQYHSRYFTRTINGVYTLIGGSDYHDYYLRQGGTLYLQPYHTHPTLSPTFTWRYEEHKSVGRQTSYDLFGRKIQPGNPPINEGTLASVEARLLWEPFVSRSDIFQLRRVDVAAEHGADWLGGDHDFTRLSASIDSRLRASTDRRSPYLRTRLYGASGFNDLPYQRFGFVESVPKPLSIFGGMRTGPTRPHRGQHVASAFWELNLRGTPLSAIGLPFLGSRWDVYVHGGHGYASVDDDLLSHLTDEQITPRVSGGGVHELGVGIGRIFRIIKLEATWRVDEPEFAFRFSFTSPF